MLFHLSFDVVRILFLSDVELRAKIGYSNLNDWIPMFDSYFEPIDCSPISSPLLKPLTSHGSTELSILRKGGRDICAGALVPLLAPRWACGWVASVLVWTVFPLSMVGRILVHIDSFDKILNCYFSSSKVSTICNPIFCRIKIFSPLK